MENKSCGCSCKNGCCPPKQEKKLIKIDFMYLDLSICERCQGTEGSLEEALSDTTAVLKSAGYEVSVNKININSKELAIKYKFVSSPTIRVNGKDIAPDVKESLCEDCGDLCGDSVDCRVWIYEGNEYNQPPKALIVNAILKEIYAPDNSVSIVNEVYKLPHNLELFFKGKKN